MNLIHEFHKIPIYNCDLNIIYTGEASIYNVIQTLEFSEEDPDEQEDIIESSEGAKSFTFCADGQYWLIFSDLTTIGSVAHEASHLLNFIFNHIDAPKNLDEDEHEAYLLGYIVDLVNEFYKSNKLEFAQSKHIWYAPVKK